MPRARQRGERPAAGRIPACRLQRSGHRLAVGPDQREQRQHEVDPAEAVDQQERGSPHPGLVQHEARPGHDRRPQDDGHEPAVDPVRNVVGHREEAQRGRPGGEDDAGGGCEDQDIVAEQQVDRDQLVAGVALIEEDHEEREAHGCEDQQPESLHQRVGDHPPDELQPAERRCGRHAGGEVARGAEKGGPGGKPRCQNPGQPEQGEREARQPASRRHAFPGRGQVVGVAFGRRDRGRQLLLQGGHAAGQAREVLPQARVHAALDLARLAFARQLLLQRARQRLAGLFVGQRPHVGVDLLGGLRQGRLGRRRGRRLLGLGRWELLGPDRPDGEQDHHQRCHDQRVPSGAPMHMTSF